MIYVCKMATNKWLKLLVYYVLVSICPKVIRLKSIVFDLCTLFDYVLDTFGTVLTHTDRDQWKVAKIRLNLFLLSYFADSFLCVLGRGFLFIFPHSAFLPYLKIYFLAVYLDFICVVAVSFLLTFVFYSVGYSIGIWSVFGEYRHSHPLPFTQTHWTSYPLNYSRIFSAFLFQVYR